MKLFAISATVALGKISQLKYQGRILDTESEFYYFLSQNILALEFGFSFLIITTLVTLEIQLPSIATMATTAVAPTAANPAPASAPLAGSLPPTT